MTKQSFNGLQRSKIFTSNKTRGGSDSFHPRGSANAMHIVFRNSGKIIVNDMTDICDIQSTSRNIRCNQYPIPSPTKSFKCGSSLSQTPSSMEHRYLMTSSIQGFSQPVSPVLRPSKHEHGLLFFLKKRKQQLRFI